MADVLETMLNAALEVLDRGDRKKIAETKRLDDVLDRLNGAIKAYLTSLDHESLDAEDDRRLSEILAFITNLEHAGDIVERGVEANLREAGQAQPDIFDRRDRRNPRHARPSCDECAHRGCCVHDRRRARCARAARRARRCSAISKHGRPERISRAFDPIESVETRALHLDMLRDLKRINAHIAAAAYPVLEQRGGLLPSRLKQDL